VSVSFITVPCAVPAPTINQARAWLLSEGWRDGGDSMPVGDGEMKDMIDAENKR
jgi:hypothetical protein